MKIVIILIYSVFGCAILFSSCLSPKLTNKKRPDHAMSGTEFYESVLGKSTKERESIAFNEITNGNMPGFLKKFSKIKKTIELNGKRYNFTLFVLPDYLSIGSGKDFARIPLTPITAQKIADSFHCFLPTRKIVDIVYEAAKVKPTPIPMYAFRDSSVTMYQHNLIIEGQRKMRKGLIAGIKKDIVSTSLLNSKPGKVAIYGWHLVNGKPIQPLYTGHVNWYVDYSHGVRLVYDIILINGKRYFYKDILQNPELQKLICDEQNCTPSHYPTEWP